MFKGEGSRGILHPLALLPATRELISIISVYTGNKSFTIHAILPWRIGRDPHWQSTRVATRWFVKTYSDSPKYSAILEFLNFFMHILSKSGLVI